MDLIRQLEDEKDREVSLFRAQLLKEDLVRLRKLCELASSAPTPEHFVASGLALAWVPATHRIVEVVATLRTFLEVFYADQRGGDDPRLLSAWGAFERHRLDVLVGCLSRVPRPDVN